MRNPLASGFVGPFAPYANAIAEQLSKQGYAPWTVQDKLHVVAKLSRWLEEQVRFLTARFGEGPVELAALQAHDITDFVLAQAHPLSPKPAQLMVTALRSFLRFLTWPDRCRSGGRHAQGSGLAPGTGAEISPAREGRAAPGEL